ncbi:hypothetical protein [Pedococcus sp. 5OH_020]|uniref:hypothetical protein n=1 Tax=Pedococcus sp. 5OH_020 TaxID=2989814 RepID=UPI0022E9A8FA|nr:hypothetical protein [Pedococcus sp. 5OH_020]
MIDVSWNIDDEEREAELVGPPRALVGTWHYLRNALRREWRIWAGLAGLGAVLGLATLVLLPPSSSGTVTLLMAHPANLDGPSAMGTDVSLLNTREVASRTVRQLGLHLTPEAFQSTVSANAVTTEILVVSVAAPDDASAVARADALSSQYLDFRATQLRSLSSGLIAGYKSRITDMQDQVTALNREYSQVSEQGAAGQTRATEILSRRTELNSQIVDMQQAIEDAALATDAAVSSTHVIDAARAVRGSAKKAMVLDIGSGLIGGTALGVGYVLFRALTTDRLRRRQDIALALGVPVRFSVRSRGPVGRRLARLRARRGPRTGWRGRDLETLVRGLEAAVMPRGGPGLELPRAAAPAGGGPRHAVALAAVGNAAVAAAVVAALATRLRDLGRNVFLVDLSHSGALVAEMALPRTRGHGVPSGRHAKGPHPHADNDVGAEPAEPAVLRPTGGPGFARGPRGAVAGAVVDLPGTGGWRQSWEAADVVLALAEVNPGIDAENLRSWVGHVVPLVTAGRSSPELLETTAELVRAAGLELPFAMMVGSDETDESLGLVETSEPSRGVAPTLP